MPLIGIGVWALSGLLLGRMLRNLASTTQIAWSVAQMHEVCMPVGGWAVLKTCPPQGRGFPACPGEWTM